MLVTAGWRARIKRRDRYTCAVAQTARLAVYNPPTGQSLRLGLEAAAYRRPRTVCLRAAGNELARWTVAAGDPQLLISPPLDLPAGLQVLTLVSDGSDRPDQPRGSPAEEDMTPLSLWVTRIGIVFDPTAGRPSVAEESDRAAMRK